MWNRIDWEQTPKKNKSEKISNCFFYNAKFKSELFGEVVKRVWNITFIRENFNWEVGAVLVLNYCFKK